MDGQSVFQYRTYHQQGRDVLRTDVTGKGDFVSGKCSSRNAERRKAFVFGIFDAGTQTMQGIYQQLDRALFHACRTGQDVGTFCYAQVSGEETHGGTCRQYINGFGHVLQGTYHHPGIVTIGQVLGYAGSVSQCVDDERTVTDAFR